MIDKIEIFIQYTIGAASCNVLGIKRGKVQGRIRSRSKLAPAREMYYGGGYASLNN